MADADVVLQMCLEMVMAVALRNRDRLLPIWPHVHEFLAAILAPSQVKHPMLTVSTDLTAPCHGLMQRLARSLTYAAHGACRLQCLMRLCSRN